MTEMQNDKPVSKTKLHNKIVKTILILSFLSFVIVSFASFVGFVMVSSSLPDVDSLKNYGTDNGLKVFSADGVLLSKYNSQNRVYTKINEIPDVVKNAFLAAE